MNDQASGLRALAARPPEELLPAPTPAFVIGSGKGGAGKSVLSIGVAAEFAALGRRVLLVDGAQNKGNLHILLGVKPGATLTGLLEGAVEAEDLLCPVNGNLALLPAESGTERLHALTVTDRARLHHRLTHLYDRFDLVVIDAGGSLDDILRVAAMRATRLVLLAQPEPTALSDAYAVIKIVTLQLPSLPIDVVVNRVGAMEEGLATFERLAVASRRFLNRRLNYSGAVRESSALRGLVSRPGSLLTHHDDDVTGVARTLLAAEGVLHDDAAAASR